VSLGLTPSKRRRIQLLRV
jgi:hypothetical protein